MFEFIVEFVMGFIFEFMAGFIFEFIAGFILLFTFMFVAGAGVYAGNGVAAFAFDTK